MVAKFYLKKKQIW